MSKYDPENPMISNMFLEDLLEILSRWGNPKVRKVSFERAASPSLVGRAPEWECEIDFPGYWHSGYGRSYVNARAPSAKEAAEKCLAAAEKFLGGEMGREARARYVSGYENDLRCHEQGIRREGRPVPHPGPMLQELEP